MLTWAANFAGGVGIRRFEDDVRRWFVQQLQLWHWRKQWPLHYESSDVPQPNGAFCMVAGYLFEIYSSICFIFWSGLCSKCSWQSEWTQNFMNRATYAQYIMLKVPSKERSLLRQYLALEVDAFNYFQHQLIIAASFVDWQSVFSSVCTWVWELFLFSVCHAKSNEVACKRDQTYCRINPL